MAHWTPAVPVTLKVKNICLEMKSKVQDQAKAQFDDYSPVDFISTNEHGVNYIYVVKVDVGEDICVHAKIFEDDGGKLILQGVQYPKKHSDPVIPF